MAAFAAARSPAVCGGASYRRRPELRVGPRGRAGPTGPAPS